MPIRLGASGNRILVPKELSYLFCRFLGEQVRKMYFTVRLELAAVPLKISSLSRIFSRDHIRGISSKFLPLPRLRIIKFAYKLKRIHFNGSVSVFCRFSSSVFAANLYRPIWNMRLLKWMFEIFWLHCCV